MKKLDSLDNAQTKNYIQEIINDLEGDLLTILESYADDMDTAELFYHMISYLTAALYECSSTKEEALKVLRLGMENGMYKHYKSEA